ncbi:MAG: RNA polymerase sigma factor [Patulibacter sp.]|nr:RNA polymerase sigma factor [Patulibacter sp.]
MRPDRRTDEQLLVAARTEAAAFGAFYRRHAPAVLSYFRRRVPEVEVAFDLTAETFAQALRSVPRYEPQPAPARAWLFGIARNTFLTSLRHGQVEMQAREALGMQPIDLLDGDADRLELLADTPALDAVGGLPAEQREVVLARLVDGESYEELAARLQCSEGVVRQRVSRGLKALRAQIEEDAR